VALRLRKAGITRVRPLLGGLQGWIDRGFPVESLPATSREGSASR